MKLLLDTHLVLWWLADSPELNRVVREEIASPENAIFVSAVSIWEISLKTSLGKLRLPAEFEHNLEKEEFEKLPLTWPHGYQVSRLPWYHRDPFDRMLIAQAQVEGLVLLTADETLGKYGQAVRVVN